MFAINRAAPFRVVFHRNWAIKSSKLCAFSCGVIATQTFAVRNSSSFPSTISRHWLNGFSFGAVLLMQSKVKLTFVANEEIKTIPLRVFPRHAGGGLRLKVDFLRDKILQIGSNAVCHAAVCEKYFHLARSAPSQPDPACGSRLSNDSIIEARLLLLR